MIINFKDGSFLSLNKEDDSYIIVICGKKADGSTTMSYVKLNEEQLDNLQNQITEWKKVSN